MMHHTLLAKYAEIGPTQVVALPYRFGNTDRAVELVLMVPKSPGDLAATEAQLPALLAAPLSRSSQVALSLPKFTLSSDHELSSALKALGVQQAFSPQADFGSLATAPLQVSAVLHKAFIAVDEDGTEAAAATAVLMEDGKVVGGEVAINADHPFVFALRDVSSGALLLLGRLADPTK